MSNHHFSKIKAVVFDLDDTLYPQAEYKRSGFKVVASWLAEKRGIDSTTVLYELESILDRFGASYPQMFDRLVERLKLKPELVAELVHVFIHHVPEIDCFEGVLPMLSRLRCKYRLGILTDGRFEVQQKKLSALGLNKKVDKILCSDTMGLQKPAPELFVWFEQQFEMDGQVLAYVGDDLEKDFYGANIREWFTVMVGTGESSAKLCNPSYRAHYEIVSITGLEKLLAENSGKLKK